MRHSDLPTAALHQRDWGTQTNRLGERPWLPRLDRHSRMAYRWSCAALRVTFLSSCARRSDTPAHSQTLPDWFGYRASNASSAYALLPFPQSDHDLRGDSATGYQQSCSKLAESGSIILTAHSGPRWSGAVEGQKSTTRWHNLAS